MKLLQAAQAMNPNPTHKWGWCHHQPLIRPLQLLSYLCSGTSCYLASALAMYAAGMASTKASVCLMICRSTSRPRDYSCVGWAGMGWHRKAAT